ALGYGVYLALASAAAEAIRARVGIAIDPYAYDASMLHTPLIMLALATVAALAPAIKAYRTDVAAHLAPTQ
ncbi:MAG: ABC transporter permease, partial [Planctomycetota bacterium]